MRRCPRCRYELEGLPATHQCPECGFEYDPSMLCLEAWSWKGRPKWYRAIGLVSGLVGGSAGVLLSLARDRTIDALVFLIVFVTGAVATWQWVTRMRRSRRGGFDCALVVTDGGVEIHESSGRRRRLAWDARRPPYLFVNDDGLHLELRPRTFLPWLVGVWPEKALVPCDESDAIAIREQVEERYTRATGQQARRPTSISEPPERRPLPPGGFNQWS